MKKFTANYVNTNANFVIQNLVDSPVSTDYLSLLYVLKNIIMRGVPTLMSKYLQSKIGELHKSEHFKDRFQLISNNPPLWVNTIKGDKANNYFPAKDFLEKDLPRLLPDYAFIQHLLLPEAEINEIVGEENNKFIYQQVDFYLPQARLVIEIDGQQHKLGIVNDKARNDYLSSKGIMTVRITTKELQNNSLEAKINAITNRLIEYEETLSGYKAVHEKLSTLTLTEEEINTKLLPTAIIRFQVLLLELLINNYLNFTEKWHFNIKLKANEHLTGFAEIAIEDTLIWLSQLFKLKKLPIQKPDYQVNYTIDSQDFHLDTKSINIDFSLLEPWTDQNTIVSEDLIFVRTDYFDTGKNYFKVSTADPLDYKVTDEDNPVLEFFLENIFEKLGFREGQLPIIANALGRKDTIGLLPTGGGKSICYQLPCLLQPAISFVVCPIKSLMIDQYQNLKNSFITNTSYITGDLLPEDKKRVEKGFAGGEFFFVWISPERFQTKSFRDYLASVNSNLSIAYAVIDEVHCLSEWGHDFRVSYLNLARTIEKYCPNASYIGLTATASVNVLKDIRVEFGRQRKNLEYENIKSLLDYSRKELVFDVIVDNGNKLNLLNNKLNELQAEDGFIIDNSKAALVFTPNVNGQYGCYGLSNNLNQNRQHKVKWYSGEVPQITDLTGNKVPVMDKETFKIYKQQVQVDFKENNFPIMVATKAFGMGIDKDNIHYTFHYGLPSSVEALYQEAGRAGRWNKTTHPGKMAKCYVLYSKETITPNIIYDLFDEKTTIAELKLIEKKVGRNGKDIFRQVFLFLQGLVDVDTYLNILTSLISQYFKANATKIIYWTTVYNTLHIKDGLLEKCIYYLSLLGIVKDWTTDFRNYYEVEFLLIDDEYVVKSLSDYLLRYELGLDISAELEKTGKKTVLEKCIYLLFQWTYENIVYTRRQSLKTLVEWCNEFPEIGNDRFKKRLDSYFRFTETTFVYQHIAENLHDIERWFESFYKVERNQSNEEMRTFIPEIIDEEERKAEFERLRDSLSRFLESYKNSTGLNFVSGLVRLFLNDYENTDGRARFESALENICNNFPDDIQKQIIDRLISIGQYLEENEKELLAYSITKYYPAQLETLAESFGMYYLLNDTLVEKLNHLKSINKSLYEHLAEI